jgi:hypothetical protein
MTQVQAVDAQNWHGNFKRNWAACGASAVVLAVILWRAAHVIPLPPEPPSAVQSGDAHWYFVIRLPEAPWDPQGTKFVQARTAEWLGALIQEGFHPMLFSDITARFKQGIGVPDKALVIVFQPGYKHTCETLEPLFTHFKSPTVWLIDRTAIQRSDPRYVHRHRAALMVQSKWWDVIDSANPVWTPGTGRSALNWNPGADHVNRLNVSLQWSGRELVNRLLAENPLQSCMQLTVRTVQGRLTGVLSTPENVANAFRLEAPLGKHSTTVAWLGTKGSPDARIDFDVPSRVGDFVLALRSEIESDGEVRLGYGDGMISIDDCWQGRHTRLAAVPWLPRIPHEALHGTLTLVGDRLELIHPGNPPLQVTLNHSGAPRGGIVRLTVYDKIRGAAFADSIRLVMTPLPAQ